MSDSATTQWWKKTATTGDALSHGLKEDEFKRLLETLGRDLNMVEIGVCAALYSEHCSYKSTKVHLKTLPTEGELVLQGPGENAGAIDIGDNQAVVFKVESHNHPTYIEPFQGAATGVGGILRDVFTMGARPVALMNSLRFGRVDHPRTPYLLSRAVAGIGTYGNCMGIPTVGGELFFHPAYDGNCLVNAFALGLVEHDQIFLGTASGVGNKVVYAGSKTGRDGIHGATMASEEFSDDSEQKRPTVQVGDPFQEKLLLEACLEAMQTGAVVGIQDMGAAGMTSSTYEMAERAGTGVRIDLSAVPQRETNMTPYEIMLSESQERMVLVVESGREQEIIDIFEHWELDAVEIGEVIEGQNVELFWEGELISSIPVALLTSSVPEYRWPEEEPQSVQRHQEFDISGVAVPEDLSAIWLNLAGNPNFCSKKPLYSQYDSTVRSNTVVHPGGDAAVVRVKRQDGKPEKGVAMTLDCNSRFCSLNPRKGAALSVVEAYRNISAVGATPLGISDCLNCGNPERPNGMFQIAESIRGMAEAARVLNTPVVSGNVSLYNETNGEGILPTPLVAMVGLMPAADKAVPATFSKEGSAVFVIGETRANELGGTEYLQQIAGVESGELPVLDYDRELETANLVRELIDKELLLSCHDLSMGGLALALVESCIADHSTYGVQLKAENFSGRKDGLLFSESGARYLVSTDAANAAEVRRLIEAAGLSISASGVVGGDTIEIDSVACLKLEDLQSRYRSSLEPLFG